MMEALLLATGAKASGGLGDSIRIVPSGNGSTYLTLSAKNNIIAANAWKTSDPGAGGQGWIFEKINNNWVETFKTTQVYYGASPAISDDGLDVCFSKNPNGYSGNGIGHIVRKTDGVWADSHSVTTATAEAPNNSGLFSRATAFIGDLLVTNRSYSGSFIYTYKKVNGIYTLHQKLESPIATTNSYYGNTVKSIAVFGDRVAISNSYHSEPGLTYSGAIFIYKKVGDDLIHEASIINKDTTYMAMLGKHIDMPDKDTIISSGLTGQSSVHRICVYKNIEGVWTLVDLKDNATATKDQYITALNKNLLAASRYVTNGNKGGILFYDVVNGIPQHNPGLAIANTGNGTFLSLDLCWAGDELVASVRNSTASGTISEIVIYR